MALKKEELKSTKQIIFSEQYSALRNNKNGTDGPSLAQFSSIFYIRNSICN